MVVLVTGSSGQLGQALQHIASNYPEISFYFADSNEADITNKEELHKLFGKHSYDYCINAAAYTAVDKAESEPEKALAVNVDGVKNLAELCKEFDCTLIHISTDFVFDGTKRTPYTETDVPNPQSVYGQTKLDGEIAIRETLEKHFIIRTSWVYSQFGSNFMKTMLRLASERDSLSVVDDQIGTPTHAVDLANAIVKIIFASHNIHNSQFTIHNSLALNPESSTLNPYGIYNFSNEGQCSWYEFAKKIFELKHLQIHLQPISTSEFPTAANRPAYSVLDKDKISQVFRMDIRPWQLALIDTLKTI